VPEVAEEVINVKLADILRKDFGIDARAERVKGRRRPDIRCYYKGFIIGIEASYNRNDAEKDAENRIKQGLVDIALALWIKEKFKDMPEEQLYEAIKKSMYDVKVFTPQDISITLLQFLKRRVIRRPEPTNGWFEDVDLPLIKAIIEDSISFMIKEEEVQKLIKEAESKFKDFIGTLRNLDPKGIIREKLYGILYRLYGLSVAESKDPDIMFGHAALSILLSTVFYEHISNAHPELQPIMDYVRHHGPIEGLRRALEDLLKIDYKEAVELTIEVLNVLPQYAGYRISSLIELGIKIASKGGLLRKDFAGRLYHKITGDIALRKGFATFYTEVPAAYLLSTLAVLSLLNLDENDLLNLEQDKAYEIVNRIRAVKLGDFACGSGTLLTASYSALMRVITALKFYYDLEDVDLDGIGKMLIEEGIYGADALRYASQITAINLALIGPSTIKKENIRTIYLGYRPEKNEALLGSLELLWTLLAYFESDIKGITERVSLKDAEGRSSIPESFDFLIMNPPFTRATYRGRREFVEEGKRRFFGFIADEKARDLLRKKYSEVLENISDNLRDIARESVEQELKGIPKEIEDLICGKADEKLRQYLNIGLAGEALPFLYLAYKYINKGGVIAFVLPRAVLAGVSWFLARVLLASRFHLKYVIVSSDPENGYNFSEGTDLSEVLLVAKRMDKHVPSEETTFVILTKKPKTAIRGELTASSIIEAKRKRELYFSHEEVEFIIRTEKREALLKHIDNWNRFVAIPEPVLSDYVFKLMTEGVIAVGDHYIKIPLTKLGNILETVFISKKQKDKEESVKKITKSIGIDAHQFYELYTETSTSPYPALIGTEEKFRMTMRIRPNAYIMPKSQSVKDKANDTFLTYAGRVLVPGVNIRWNTSHVIALYSDQGMLSNTHYAIKLNVGQPLKLYAEKALVLWFNTTWGLLTILVNREETEGAWAQLKMGQWILMPVLDVTSLRHEILTKLAEIFDKYAEKSPRRIPEQFDPSNPDPIRLGIDKDFIKALNPSIDDKVLEKKLINLYKLVNIALRRWIGEEKHKSTILSPYFENS
jgi:hypothetical protein